MKRLERDLSVKGIEEKKQETRMSLGAGMKGLEKKRTSRLGEKKTGPENMKPTKETSYL
jgi:hypothetical protein